MRRTMSTLVLAASLAACGSPFLGEPVTLLTGEPLGPGACYTFGATGELVVDPEYGTAIIIESWPHDHEKSPPIPVMWRPGFTARRTGTEVAVLDPAGQIVATTGRKYELEGGGWYGHPQPFFACGSVHQR